jgi:hypothetical protein
MQETSLPQEPQVTRNSRLTLSKDLSQFGHGELRMRTESKDAKASGLSRRSKQIKHLSHM